MALVNMQLGDVDPDDLDTNKGGGWKAMPEGWYRFMIVSSDFKPSASGAGKRIGLEFRCVEPKKWNGEKKFEYLSVVNKSADTVRIAKAHLKQIAIAVDHPSPDLVRDTNELHDVPMWCKVVQEEESNPKYGDVDGMRNRLVAYRHLNDVPDQAIAASKQAAKVPAPAPKEEDIPDFIDTDPEGEIEEMPF